MNRQQFNSNYKSKITSSTKKPPATKPKPFLQTINVKDPVEVYCRLRPAKHISSIPCVERCNDNTVRLKPLNNGKSEQYYNFKYVFADNCQQSTVFETVAYPLLKDLLNGKNGLLFTYGVTSSGKTFTIAGTPENTGLLPRSLDVIFNSIGDNLSRKYVFKPTNENLFEIRSSEDALLEWQKQRSATIVSTPRTPSLKRQRKDNNFKIWENREKETMHIELIEPNNKHAFAVFVSYVQIYNNYIYDLLDESFDDNLKFRGNQEPRPKLLRENAKRRVFVVNGTEVEVRSSEEAFDLFLKGLQRLRVAQTALNAESSRSHSVFNIRIVQAPRNSDNEILIDENSVTVSQLSLVDLAGSERTGRTQTTGDRLKEASNINNSLMSLRNCIDILRDNQKFGQKKIVPYRDNKLTHLFKSFFEGEGKIRMVICVHPDAEDFDETLHVMKFAEVTSEVVVTRCKENVFRYIKPSIDNELLINMPPTELTDPSDDAFYPSWITYIKSLPSENRFSDTNESNKSFRRNLAEMESEYMFLKQRDSQLKRDLEIRENQLREFENKMLKTESIAETYRNKFENNNRKCKELDDQIRILQQRINNFDSEVENLRHQAKERIRNERQNLRTAFSQMVNDLKSELEHEKGLNKEKVNFILEIFKADSNNFEFLRDIYPNTNTQTNLNQATEVLRPFSNASTTPMKRRTQTESTLQQNENEYQSESGPPVVNPRHRRSLSTGNEKWIDHRPQGTLDLGTVLQPMIKNKVSVSNLKSFGADNIKECSKYALTHHVADKQGEVETQIFKGEVIPSVSGGAQVIFQDVETLKQKSPPGRKRMNDEVNIDSETTGVPVHLKTPASTTKKRSRH